MFNIYEWIAIGSALGAIGGVVFKIGRIVEKSANAKYTTKEHCNTVSEQVKGEIGDLKTGLDSSLKKIDRLYWHLIPKEKRREYENGDGEPEE